jgi:hypothetical protein
MKYITLQEKQGHGLRTALFCLPPLTHRQMAEAFATTHKVIGAGFVELDPLGGKPVCFGVSESLGRGPAPGDEELIQVMVKQARAMMPAPPRPVHASQHLALEEAL